MLDIKKQCYDIFRYLLTWKFFRFTEWNQEIFPVYGMETGIFPGYGMETVIFSGYRMKPGKFFRFTE